MPTSIACPGCRRALTLPDEALNAMVQCPACKHQFHPASADAAEARVAPPKLDLPPAAPPAVPASAAAPRRPSRGGPPLMDPPPRRSRRRREDYDVCPKCRARVPANVDRCPECDVEFEAEDESRPWERTGEERADSEPARGGLVLTFGISSMIGSFVLGCPMIGLISPYVYLATTVVSLSLGVGAWVMGQKDLRKMDQHAMDRSGHGSTQGGMICGIIGAALSTLAAILAVIMVINKAMQ